MNLSVFKKTFLLAALTIFATANVQAANPLKLDTTSMTTNSATGAVAVEPSLLALS